MTVPHHRATGCSMLCIHTHNEPPISCITDVHLAQCTPCTIAFLRTAHMSSGMHSSIRTPGNTIRHLSSRVIPQAGLIGHAVGSKLPCAARRHVRPLAQRTGSGQSSPEPANRSSSVQGGRGTCWPQPQRAPRRPRLQHHCKCLLTSAARAARRACANAAAPSVRVRLMLAGGVVLHSESAKAHL